MEGLQVLLWMFNISVSVAVFLGFIFFLRWKYQKDVSPDKKHPLGKIMAEFWTTAGPRVRYPVWIKPSGNEIDLPMAAKSEGGPDVSPRYFFTKSSMGWTKYPLQPLLPFKFVQVDIPIVSWIEDCQDPIDPKRVNERGEVDEKGNKLDYPYMMTPTMHDLVRDTDTLAAGEMMLKEEKERQEEIARVLATAVDKKYVYIGLVAAVACAMAAAVFAYQAFAAITSYTGG